MDPTLNLNVAQSLAVFLRDFGGYAMASLFLIGYVWRDRQLRVSDREKFELAMSIAPLAEALVEVLEHTANKARIRSYNSRPPPSAGGGEDLHG